MKNFLIYLLFIVPFTLQAQKKSCESPEEPLLEDLNAITSTKCSIKDSKDGKRKSTNLFVSVSARKSHFLKKRVHRKATSNQSINSGKLTSLKTESINLKNNTLSVLNTLSLEEVRSCSKLVDADKIANFSSCSNVSKNEQMKCFNKGMIAHIQEYFRYPDDAIIKKIEGEVWVRFIIDKTGNVTNVKVHAPSSKQILKDEALRVVSHLPKFIPAVNNGENIPVKYGFPINFSLQE